MYFLTRYEQRRPTKCRDIKLCTKLRGLVPSVHAKKRYKHAMIPIPAKVSLGTRLCMLACLTTADNFTQCDSAIEYFCRHWLRRVAHGKSMSGMQDKDG